MEADDDEDRPIRAENDERSERKITLGVCADGDERERRR